MYSSSRPLSHRKIQILSVLNEHPLMSLRQLELYCGCSESRTQRHLKAMQERNWVRRYNAKQQQLYTRSLYSLTRAGLEILLTQRPDLAPCSLTRVATLALRIERVFKVRNLMLWLANARTWNWRLADWNCEVGVDFVIRDQRKPLPFPAAARLVQPDGRWITALIEFDNRRIPISSQRDRWRDVILAQDDPRFHAAGAYEFPILVILADDRLRLQAYYTLLHSMALKYNRPMPVTYLALVSDAVRLRTDAMAPIWYSTESDRRTSLLAGVTANPRSLPPQPVWQTLPSQRGDSRRASQVALKPWSGKVPVRPGLIGFASLSLSLTPVDKLLLDEVARHPLLMASELADLLQLSFRHVDARLKQLTQWRLIECYRASYSTSDALVLTMLAVDELKPHSQPWRFIRYSPAPLGIRYLSAVAGLERHVKQYARARGWRMGFVVLLKNAEHTRQENAVFVQLAQIARRRNHQMTWLSELESRIHYKHNDRQHSFMPDGRGTYVAGTRRYDFAVEIERSRPSHQKLRTKFAEYIAYSTARVLQLERLEALQILIVSTTWKRIEHMLGIIQALAQELAVVDPLPFYFTTFEDVEKYGADRPIWVALPGDLALKQRKVELKTYCFDCFRPSSDSGKAMTVRGDGSNGSDPSGESQTAF